MLSLFLSCNLKFVFYMFCFLFACGYADGWKAGGTAVAVSTISTQKTASLTHRAGKLGWDDEKWRGGWLWFALVGAVKFFFEFCFDIQRHFILFWMKTRQPHNWCLFLTASHGQFRGHSKSAPLFKRFKHLPKVWPRSRVAISEECLWPKVAIHFSRFTRQRKAWSMVWALRQGKTQGLNLRPLWTIFWEMIACVKSVWMSDSNRCIHITRFRDGLLNIRILEPSNVEVLSRMRIPVWGNRNSCWTCLSETSRTLFPTVFPWSKCMQMFCQMQMSIPKGGACINVRVSWRR